MIIANVKIDLNIWIEKIIFKILLSSIFGKEILNFEKNDNFIRQLENIVRPKFGFKSLFILMSAMFSKLLKIEPYNKNDVESVHNKINFLKSRLLDGGFLFAMEKDSKSKNKKKITTEELDAQLLQFFLAGQAPLQSVFTQIIYYLSRYENYQEEIFKEILSESGKYGFLNAFIMQSLRLSPPLLFVEHELEKTILLNLNFKSLELHQGLFVELPIYAIHRNPDYYFHPNKFDPKRTELMDKHKNTLKFIPFSVGPRSCMGKQYSLNVLKILIQNIVKNFNIKINPNYKLSYIDSPLILQINNPMFSLEIR